MLPLKSASFCAIALALLALSCLPGCTSWASKRSNERAALCDQPRVEVPAWPRSEFEAYAIELLGVIADDRSKTQIERECRSDL
jgi:hypothetical protein